MADHDEDKVRRDGRDQHMRLDAKLVLIGTILKTRTGWESGGCYRTGSTSKYISPINI